MNSGCIWKDFNNKTLDEFQVVSVVYEGEIFTFHQYEIYGVNDHCLLHACNIMSCGMKSLIVGRMTIAID